jgi:hypothetical protein
MKILLLVLMAILHWTDGQINYAAPGKLPTQEPPRETKVLLECAARCWGNTQYVSKRRCAGDAACLCSERDYQSVSSNPRRNGLRDTLQPINFYMRRDPLTGLQAVFQCLYSQCDTVHFGSALHHTIAQCFGTESEMVLFAAPPIPHREDLRRREEEYAAGAKLYGSDSGVGYPTESVSFLTQSVGYATQSVGYTYSPNPSSSPLPLFSPDTATSPALASATSTMPIYNAIPAVTPAGAPQQVFVGLASALVPAFPSVALSLVATLYLTL